jgi:hypothetical protein
MMRSALRAAGAATPENLGFLSPSDLPIFL